MSMIKYIFIIFFLVSSINAQNTSAVTKDKLTISYVYSLAKYIDFKNDSKLFTISLVSSNNTLNKEFKALAKHTLIDGKKIKLYISQNKNTHPNSNIIFIDIGKNHLYKDIFLNNRDNKSLLISNSYSDKKFVMINLYTTDKNTMKFEINRANILSKGLSIDPQIILLGGTELDIAYLYKDTRDSLSSKELELNKMYTELKTTKKHLQDQQVKLNSLKKTNLIFKKKIVEKEKKLQTTKKEIKKYSTDVKNLKGNIEVKNLKIAAKEQKLITLLEEFHTTQNELQEIKSSLNAKMLKSQELETLIVQKTKILQKLKLRLEDKNILLQTHRETISYQKEILWLALGALILFLIVTAVILHLLKKQKITNKLLEITQEELKIAKDQAEVASNNKSKFVASMSHELRTPLNAVLGYSQLLQNDMTIAQKHQDTFSIIRKSGEHLLGLINNILLISKIESGNIQVHNKSVNIKELLNGVYSMFLLKTQGKDIDLELIIDEDFPLFVETDIDILRQVLINLLNNSVKFTNNGGIKIFAKYSDNNLIISIQDTGVGIQEEEMELLFKQYQQTQSGIKEGHGTGLGLSLVEEFIKVLNGSIQVESEYSKGSKFTIQIPCVEAVHKEESKLEIITSLIQTKKTFKVLIVDDTKTNRDLLEKLLTSIGFLTQQASDGLKAIEFVKKQRPDIILMDLKMPNIDGIETTKLILDIDNSIPVIAVSANILEMEHLLKDPKPFVCIVPKPFDTNELLYIIADSIDVKYNYAKTLTKEAKPSTIKSLSKDETTKLLQAVNSSNLTLIDDLINGFEEIDFVEQKYLQELVKEFNFDELKRILSLKKN